MKLKKTAIVKDASAPTIPGGGNGSTVDAKAAVGAQLANIFGGGAATSGAKVRIRSIAIETLCFHML